MGTLSEVMPLPPGHLCILSSVFLIVHVQQGPGYCFSRLDDLDIVRGCAVCCCYTGELLVVCLAVVRTLKVAHPEYVVPKSTPTISRSDVTWVCPLLLPLTIGDGAEKLIFGPAMMKCFCDRVKWKGRYPRSQSTRLVCPRAPSDRHWAVSKCKSSIPGINRRDGRQSG